MEVDMELSKKTTILFSPELHRRLTQLAARRQVSLGELVREACEIQYGVAGSASRLEAVRGLAGLALPVGTTGEMKHESQPAPDGLLP
jgi:predicted transcriptional regulator